jgi:hypothetical protein
MDLMSELVLAPAVRRAFERLAGDGRRVFGDRFRALLAYDPTHSVLFAGAITSADLDALGALAETWHKDGLDTPLVMTPDEFRRSLDAFPLEYQSIVDRHLCIAGEDLLAGVEVRADDLRRACEVQAKAHLIHLRQGWIEAAGHADEQAELIERSAAPLRALLTNIARLTGRAAADPAGLAQAAAELFGMPAPLVNEVLALETAPQRSRTLVDQLPEYLDASERLWATIDRWRTP